MYKHICQCGAIHIEIDSDNDMIYDTGALLYGDSQSFTHFTSKEALSIDCAPSMLGSIAINENQTQYFCNDCAAPLFIETQKTHVMLNAFYYGHDAKNDRVSCHNSL
jgi:hypothetical protein